MGADGVERKGEGGSYEVVKASPVLLCKFSFCAPGFANLLGFCVPFEQLSGCYEVGAGAPGGGRAWCL